MSVAGAFKDALRDLYEQSWRLLLLNVVLALLVALALLGVSYATPAVLLLVGVGPFAAALVHCAVRLHDEGELRLGDALVGLRLHWRRGLALGGISVAVVVLLAVSIRFYAHRAWPLALLSLYLGIAFMMWQIHLWPLAVARRGERFGTVLRDAAAGLFGRPWRSLGLAAGLLLVNALGAVAVLPLLTLTVAYSALAATHFALPPRLREEVSP